MSLLRRVAGFITEHEFWLLWVYAAPVLVSSSLPLSVLGAAVATVPVFWIARRLARGAFSVRTPLDVPIILLGCLGVVGILVSIDTTTSLRLYLEFLGGAALYYGIVNSAGAGRIPTGIWILLGLAAGMSIVGTLGLRVSEKFVPPAIVALLPRLDLSVLNPRGFTPNIVAGAIAPIIPLALAWAFVQTSLRRVLVLALAVMVGGAVILTQSRGALMGIVVAVGVLLVWRFSRLVWLLPVIAVAGVAAIALVGPANLLETVLSSDSTGTAAGRLELWDRALWIMSDFPFTGIGLGTFEKVVPVLYPLFINDPNAPLPHAHNLYLQMGVDYGIGGVVAFIGLVATAFATALSNVRHAMDRAGGWIAIGLFAAYLVYLLHGLLDAVAISTKVSVVVWFVLGLIVALARQGHETRI